MRIILNSRRCHYAARVSIFLITVALIAGLIGCGGGGGDGSDGGNGEYYNLTIASTVGGNVTTPGEGTSHYDEGTVVNLVAEAEEGYQFLKWTGSIGATADVYAAETTITVNYHCSITANFAKGIWDWHDLDAIRDNLGGHYVLMNDLDSTTAGYDELASPAANQGKGWQPIGSLIVDPVNDHIADLIDPFTGSLDGQGYEIRDLYIIRPDEDGVGLFGSVSGGVVIENLGVVNAQVTGHDYVGSLVGENHEGTVSNSYSTGSVTGYQWVGGLLGMNEWASDVSNLYSTGDVGGQSNVGGLMGGNSGTVGSSYSTGSVTSSDHSVGGLAGGNWGTVRNSYSTVSVTGAWNVGGLVGWNHHGTVRNSYYTGSVTGGNVGGLVGENHEGTVSNSYYSYDERRWLLSDKRCQ